MDLARAAQAAEGARGEALPPPGRGARPPRRRAAHRRHPPGPRAAVARGGASGSDLYFRISTITLVRPAAARAAPRTSRSWPAACSSGSRGEPGRGRASTLAPRRAARAAGATPGPATCASCATCSSARCCSAATSAIGPGDLRFESPPGAEARGERQRPHPGGGGAPAHRGHAARGGGQRRAGRAPARHLEELALPAPEAVRHRTVRILDPASGIRTWRRAPRPRLCGARAATGIALNAPPSFPSSAAFTGRWHAGC